jgi:5,5'-dehydrodivanillate O-demethylase
MGELLRRYWIPLAPASEIDEKGKRQIRLLGEDLVLYKDGAGHYGLLAEQCVHRSASLFYGRVEPVGLRCPYHGWRYDERGRCLEQPAEPADSTYKNTIQQPAYPVEELGGVLFGYLGPAPVPLLPRYDILVREDWVRRIEIHPVLDCNWLQPMENAVDPAHLYWLHGYAGGAAAAPDERMELEPFEYGIYKYHFDEHHEEVHPLVFPHILRGPGNVIHFRIPMDDTHTGVLYVLYGLASNGSTHKQEHVPYSYIGPIKDEIDDYGFPRFRHHMRTFASHDGMAWETQGAIADRSREHLASSDRGIAAFRKMLWEQLEAMENGRDPIGVIRDPGLNGMIEFKVETRDRHTGELVPIRNYDTRSFARPTQGEPPSR